MVLDVRVTIYRYYLLRIEPIRKHMMRFYKFIIISYYTSNE
jgi:hypothetical protein